MSYARLECTTVYFSTSKQHSTSRNEQDSMQLSVGFGKTDYKCYIKDLWDGSSHGMMDVDFNAFKH